MTKPRDLATLGGGFTQSGTGAIQRTVENKLKDTVSVKDFGAVGNGVTDDLAKLKLAMETGKVVDGGGLSYAVNGTLAPTSFAGLINATLIQIGSNTATNFQTLSLVGLSNFIISNVTINMGTNITTLYSDDGNNGLQIWGSQSGTGVGTTTSYIENFTLDNVVVTGNGCGTGIHIRHAKRFKVLNCTVRDRISGSSPDPTNDSQNGFQINNCANFEITSCSANNLLTRLSSVNTNKWTRGFLFAEIRDCSITGCGSVLNDQGYDFSGGVSDTSPSSYQGNRQFTITGCTAAVNGTFGFKFANVTHDALIAGCIANNVAATGFVVSSQSTSVALSNNSYRTQNLTFTGCKTVNSLNNSWSGYTSAGFYVDQDASGLYPRNVKFVGCSVEDNQATPTTVSGFTTSVLPIEPSSTGYNKDLTITTKNCSTFNVTTPYSNIHFAGGSFAGTGAGSIPTSTWASVDFTAADIYDPSGIHNPSSNADNFYIKEAGLYFVTSTVMFAANATGLRKIRVAKNGASTGLEYTYAAHATNVTTVTASVCLYFATGDNVRTQVWQDSGTTLNVERASSFFVINRVA
jgi:hypothetical protein